MFPSLSMFLSALLWLNFAFMSFAAPAPPPAKSNQPKKIGDGTFYSTGLGSCGITNKDTDFIAAASHELYDTLHPGFANPNKNPICNKVAVIKYKGKTVTVKVTDRCGGCKGKHDLDLSPAAFAKLADPKEGRLHGIEWHWQ